MQTVYFKHFGGALLAVLVAVIVMVLLGVSLSAQIADTSSLYGNVRDVTDAVIPGAEVEAKNLDTGVTRKTVTTETGDFSISNLPVGNYLLTVRMPGFKTFTREGILLRVDQRVMVNPILEVGDVNEQVVVKAEASLIETSRSTLKHLLDQKRVSELPLQGRNILSLTLLVPGVQPTAAAFINQVYTSPNQVFISASGGRGNTTVYNLDGVDNSDTYTNVANAYPNPDGIEALNIETNSYSAEHGRRGGAIVNAVTRSGTNEYHGSLFEFVRNYNLNATPFFTPGRPDFLKRHQFGGSLGGPIFKDKTFFFGTYQRTTFRRTPLDATVVVPTQAMRNGDFSNLRTAAGALIVVKDPVTGQPFPGNQIPTSRFDPISQGILKFIPTPADSTGRLLIARPRSSNNDQWVTRIDHMLSSANRLTGRLVHDRTDSASGVSEENILTAVFKVDFRTTNFSLSDTHTFSPHLLGIFSATLNRLWSASGGDYPTTFQDLGANIVNLSPRRIMEVSVGGFFSLTRLDPVILVRNNYQYQASLNYVSGRHEVKFGADVIRQQFNVPLAGLVSNGLFIFGNELTGSNITDFMLGRSSLFIQSTGWNEALRATQAGFYIQDRFKATRRLTFDVGLRYEPYLPWVDVPDKATAKWIPGVQSTRSQGLPKGVVLAGEQGVPDGGHRRSLTKFAPRLGFAYLLPDEKTSVRGGYGVYFDFPNAVINNRFASAVPFVVRIDIQNPPSLQNPFTAEQPNPFPAKIPAPSGFVFPRPVIAVTYGDEFTNSYMQQWNLTLEHQIVPDWLARISYMGSKGTKLLSLEELNPARFIPGSSTPQNINQRRIFAPDFASVESLESRAGSNYNAVAFSVDKRFTRGYTITASYTFGKSTDYQSNIVSHGQSVYTKPGDRGYDHAVSDFDHKHRVVSSIIWELPTPTTASSALRHIAGNWQVNSIIILQSGGPFSVFAGSDRSLDGVGSDRPNLLRDPHLDTGRPKGEKIARYFDISAFRLNDFGTYGTAGRNIIRGPGLATVDLSLFKNIPLRGERMILQFRGEAFNLFNRSNFANPNGTFTSPLFGRISATSVDARVLQLALRMTF